MNKPGKELKRIARQNLCGHFGIPMGVSLVATLLPLVLELPFSMLQDTHQALFQTIVFYVANFLISLVTVILSAGVIRVHLSMARKQPLWIFESSGPVHSYRTAYGAHHHSNGDSYDCRHVSYVFQGIYSL